jgi:hypothetical protein
MEQKHWYPPWPQPMRKGYSRLPPKLGTYAYATAELNDLGKKLLGLSTW